ncbi:MAG: hypothetical protein A2Y62_06550 [Candidatus Fischerbacteria bacterium RBG_13_37_8]|uniref:Fibronectin type-III domain-containing protein n=1 Tax=Candidatus Fischerbacteria bacterium RBG_13_37_8 TaxID=1817863 RepID=A0A1F5VD94_9BACT|nr:MAG: hypothetical protein A2Y62_06550 [Candidatus Fischerbacteria bacterium RBG_13_37_8]
MKEDDTRFYAVALLKRTANSLTLATVKWAKYSFDRWWDDIKGNLSLMISEPFEQYNLPEILTTTCGGDYWIATTLTNVPAARRLHTAVWTGTEMIVWGGFDSGYLNTGGQYCAVACSAPVFTGIETVTDDACDTGISIAWQQPTSWGNGASDGTYDVRRYENATCLASWVTVASDLNSSVTSFIDITATVGATYYYQVVAKNNCDPFTETAGTTFCSTAIVDQIGTTPSGLNNNTAADVSVCTNTGVEITWDADPGNWGDNGVGTRTYDVLRDGNSIASGITYGTTNYTDAGATPDTTYTYKIRYNNGCGLSSITTGIAIADIDDTTPCPNVANTLFISKVLPNASLTWLDVTCADLLYYRVYGSTTYDAPFPSGWTLLDTPIVNSYDEPLSSNYLAFKTVSRYLRQRILVLIIRELLSL